MENKRKCARTQEMVLCCFCAKKIPFPESNNPRPVYENGRCCSECNKKIVLPARLGLIGGEQGTRCVSPYAGALVYE